MPRIPRIDVGNEVYHVINRANARLPIFFQKEDYVLFETILEEAQKSKVPDPFDLVLNQRYLTPLMHPK